MYYMKPFQFHFLIVSTFPIKYSAAISLAMRVLLVCTDDYLNELL